VVPPHVEYSLTPLGAEAAARVVELSSWIEGNLPQILHGKADLAA
jgi:DNA-binding HxlR family transcriptional regulator